MSAKQKTVRPLSDLLLLFAGPTIWFGHFAFIYGAEAVICIGPAASDSQRMAWTYALATAGALTGLVLLAATLVRQRRDATGGPDRDAVRFLPRAALALVLLSLLGVSWTIVPAAVLPPCASAGVHPPS
jgi:hypothetical protein